MKRAIGGVAAAVILLACGPKPAADVNEPGDMEETVEADEGSDEVEAGGEEKSVGVEDDDAVVEEDADPQEIVGSASQDEVEPMKYKEYNVDLAVEFSPAPDATGKQGVLDKVGAAGLPITLCYRKLVLDDAEMQGDMKVSVKIKPGGVAKPVEILDNTTGSDKLGACVVKELKKQKYPKKLVGKKTVDVTVILEFRPYLK